MTISNRGTQNAVLALRSSMASALCYGCITSLASLAISYGVQVELLIIARSVVVSLLCATLLAMRCESLTIRRFELTNLLVMSVTIVLTSFFQLTAIKHISVGLTVLLFFTFPVLVALHDCLQRQSLVQPSVVALSIFAFVGVAVATGAKFDHLDWLGVMFAFLAAISMACSILVARRSLVATPVLNLALGSNLAASALALMLWFVSGQSSLLSTDGDIGLSITLTILVGVLFAFGMLFQFHSIKRIGSTLTSIVLNCEPVLALVAARLIIGEEIEIGTVVGAILIVLSILVATSKMPHRWEREDVDASSQHRGNS